MTINHSRTFMYRTILQCFTHSVLGIIFNLHFPQILATFWDPFSSFLLFSCSVMSHSLQPHALQHARLPCPSPTPGACSNSCPLSWWCHPTISSSVVTFSSCLQFCPESGSSLMSQLFTSDSHKYWSFSFSISPSNEYSGLISFRTDWSPCCPRDSQESSPIFLNHNSKASILWCLAFFMVEFTSVHYYWKTIALTIRTFVGKVMSLLLIHCLGLP